MNTLVYTGVLIALLYLAPIQYGEAKVQKGDIISKDDWMFVAKFCFDTEGVGNLTWTAWADDTSDLYLLFYDDVPESWPHVYNNRHKLSCHEKRALAKGNATIINNVQQVEAFIDYVRPHYWYVAVSDCTHGKLNFQYDFKFINAGGHWARQFSFDEQGLPQMYLFFWLLFTLGAMLHLKAAWDLHRAAAFHPVVRLLSASILIETGALFFLFIHYAVYISNGVGAPGLLGLGEILSMAAQLVFMFLLILLSKGWAITRNQLEEKRLLVIAFAVFLLAYLIMFIWQNVGIDPASTLYVYETAPGIIILVLRTGLLCWFLWNLRSSYQEEKHPNKRKFYFSFGMVYTVWFLMLPFIVILAVAFSGWYRAKVVTGMVLTMNTLGFFALAFLLAPPRAYEYFQITRTDLLLGANSSPYETL